MPRSWRSAAAASSGTPRAPPTTESSIRTATAAVANACGWICDAARRIASSSSNSTAGSRTESSARRTAPRTASPVEQVTVDRGVERRLHVGGERRLLERPPRERGRSAAGLRDRLEREDGAARGDHLAATPHDLLVQDEPVEHSYCR